MQVAKPTGDLDVKLSVMISLKSFVTVGVPTGPQEASLRFLTASEEGDFFKGFNSIQGHLFSMRMLMPQLYCDKNKRFYEC